MEQNVDNDNFIIVEGTKIKVSVSEFNDKKFSEKIRGKTEVGKIIWVPRKLLKKVGE